MIPRRSPLTVVLASGCLLASLPLLLIPSLRETVGNGASLALVRLLTSPFVHGFSTASLVPHLAGNLVLLWYAGSRVERALGTGRFALLTLGALGAYGAIQALWALDVNGASVFVWAYAPPLAVAHRSHLLREHGSAGDDATATPIVLTVMWVVVPIAMTTVPYAFGWSGGFVRAFLVANTFHLSATAVGIGGAWIWRDRLRPGGAVGDGAVAPTDGR